MQAILDAILAGERDPQKLAALRDRRIKASEATIAQALIGDFRAEHFELGRDPCRAARRQLSGVRTPSASTRISRRWRSACTPSQTRYAAPTYFTAWNSVSDARITAPRPRIDRLK